MPQHVLLAIAPQAARVTPGEETTLALTVRNLGADADLYQIHVTGLQEEWYSLSRADLAIAPHAETCARLTLHPTRGGETMAGRYPFRVHVTSCAGTERRASAVAELVIGINAPFSLTVEPHEATGRTATFRVTLSNSMDFPASLTLGVYCEEAGLQASANPAGPVTVPAGGTTVVNLSVSPIIRNRAMATRAYELEIWAALPGQESGRSPQLAQYVRFTPAPARPRVFGWLRR